MGAVTREARLSAAGWRRGLGIAVAAVVAPAAAALTLGFGGLYSFIALGIVLQIATGAGYGPDVWAKSRRGSALRVLPLGVVFWVTALVLLPRAADRLSAGEVLVGLGVAAVVYLAFGAFAASDARRALWAWPLVLAASVAPLAYLSITASRPRPVPPAVAVDADAPGMASRVLGASGSEAGTAVLGVGDVNHDGRADWLLGLPAPGFDPGAVELVHGSAGAKLTASGVSGPGSAIGLRIVGRPGDELGYSLALIGDLNGDGRRDYLIGAPNGANAGGLQTGEAYVVYAPRGNRRLRIVDLDRPGGPAGFRIDGAFPGDATGYSVADAGDVNGDGIDDLLVGAPRLVRDQPAGTGAVYVVFGKRNRTPVELASISSKGNTQGYRIQSVGLGTAGLEVAGVGDVNGDGRPDALIGMPDMTIGSKSASGGAFVIYGQKGTRAIDLARIGLKSETRGFRIDGAHSGDNAGQAVVGLGDVNGDGRPDLAVGAPHASNLGRPRSGSAYVIFGRARTGLLELSALGSGSSRDGYRIDGTSGRLCIGVPCGDQAGAALAAAGDVNGDGLADLIVGAPTVLRQGQERGSVFVVYGKRTPGRIDLALIGTGSNRAGYRIDGLGIADQQGYAVASAGDVNGDRKPDILIGTPDADNENGAAYAVTGRPPER